MAKILVTGAAGFIGYHTSERLLARGDEVVGLDIVNNYYDPTLRTVPKSPCPKISSRLCCHPPRA